MIENLLDILHWVTFCLSVIYPLLYLKGFAKNGRAFKVFTIYLVVIAIVQVSMKSYKLVTETGVSNLFFFIYYFVLQFVFLSLFYKELLRYKWIHILTAITLIFIGFQYVSEPSLYFKYNPIGSSITQIIIVLYTLLYFYKSLSGKRKFLIINVGLFFYLLSSLLIFASGNLVLNDAIPKSISKILSNFNLVFYFIFQILIIIEWYRNYRIVKE